MVLSAFEVGIGSAVDLYTNGYDTHRDHDALHEPLFAHLVESIDLLWIGTYRRSGQDIRAKRKAGQPTTGTRTPIRDLDKR